MGNNFGFPVHRARQLAHRGLWCLRDLWTEEQMTLKPSPELQQQFELVEAERPHIELYQTHLPQAWLALGQDLYVQVM